MNPITGWTVDISNWQTINPVRLITTAAQLYALSIGLDDTAYYKRVR